MHESSERLYDLLTGSAWTNCTDLQKVKTQILMPSIRYLRFMNIRWLVLENFSVQAFVYIVV